MHLSTRACGLLAIGVLALATPAFGGEPWGTDTNTGDGPKLVEATAPALAAIVAAAEADRPALIAAYAAGKAADQIEAVKRFRSPELRALFVALAKHAEWKVRHRALFALDFYGDPADLPLAFAALDDAEPRLRQKAAISAIKMWSDEGAAALDIDGDGDGDGDAATIVAERLAAETDPHVYACLRALQRRMAGTLTVRKVYTEHLEKRSDGLLITPFLSGMNTAPTVAPNYSKSGISEISPKAAAKLPFGPWTTPIILMGQEARSGMSLQPFANLRAGGKTYHTGLDHGACLDGGGYHAVAPGIVKFVYTGSDMGTMLVVQHHVGQKRYANAVYMHGGDTVFVKSGDTVESGQLLSTMGMGYSIENGGHYAHLHFGLYPGEFSKTHNYGYRGVSAGLSDWYEPEVYLPHWIELTAPLVSMQRPQAAVAKAMALLAEGKPGAAYKEAKGKGEAGDQLRTDLEAAIAGAVARAEKQRDLGYPTMALETLRSLAKAGKGIPGAQKLGSHERKWKKAKAMKAAVKAEQALLVTHDQAIALAGKPAQATTLWEGFLAKHKDTCLAPRIERLRAGVQKNKH